MFLFPSYKKKKACSSQPTPWYIKLVQKPAIWVCFNAGQHPEAETYPHPTLWISFFSFQWFTGFLEINNLTNTKCCSVVFSSQHIWDFWSNGFCMNWRSKKTTTNNRVALKKKKKNPVQVIFPWNYGCSNSHQHFCFWYRRNKTNETVLQNLQMKCLESSQTVVILNVLSCKVFFFL